MRKKMNNKQLFARIKAHFVSRETSLQTWCKENNIKRQNARSAVVGEWRGEKATALRERLATEAGISKAELATISHEHLA